ncbi:MAG: GDSL-type esterase/lipase family protein [Candidatus Sulfotelmatobacter sp.]
MRVRVLAGFLLLLFLLAMLEGAARLVFHFKSAFHSNLNEYQMVDPANHHLWILRPGYSQTLNGLVAEKQRTSHTLAVDYLAQRGAQLGVHPEDVLFQVDRDGFKGPEIDKSHSRVRILTIGDSCTFGSWFDQYSYPRALERELKSSGRDVEVINAGVEGYSPTQVLARINEFKALRPEITTIYIGWNALFSDDALPGGFHYYTWMLLERSYERLFPYRAALESYQRPKHPNRNDPKLVQLEGYVPPFLKDVQQIVREMKGAGSKVVLITLPGLFATQEEPSARALQIGHLPRYTSNPFVVARMAERYNVALRDLGQQDGVQVIDLEKWSAVALQPRDKYFFDSVHLYEEGQAMIGKEIAAELAPTLNAAQATAPHTSRKESD